MLILSLLSLLLLSELTLCENWTLVWSDEFNGHSVDLQNWQFSDACEGRTPSQRKNYVLDHFYAGLFNRNSIVLE